MTGKRTNKLLTYFNKSDILLLTFDNNKREGVQYGQTK